MIADVVDADELNTHERREGMYGSIFWWVVKLGQAVAIAGGGILLTLTGFDVTLGGNQAPETITYMRMFDAFVPCIASGVAIWAIATFSITEDKAYEIRMELEKRRGGAVSRLEPGSNRGIRGSTPVYSSRRTQSRPARLAA